jgi:hypothetical protein
MFLLRPSASLLPGLWMRPDTSGQSPPRTRNRLLLPLPLGPVISKLDPGSTSRVRSSTRVVPAGVTTWEKRAGT